MILREYSTPFKLAQMLMSRPQPYEHLMFVYFDILLLDDDVCLKLPHRKRRLLLQSIVKTISGRAAIAEQEILDFGRPDSQHRLAVSFSNAVTQRWEGFVLKACDEPYFPMHCAGVDDSFGRWVKLKKDYIAGLGDTIDLALIGASYDAQHAAAITCRRKLRWTHFLVGCLLNKEQVVEGDGVPRFRVVDVITRHSMHRDVLMFLNQFGEFYACDPEGFDGFEFEYGYRGIPTASAFFKKPFVAELMGAGFEKPSGARYFALRFPRILKIYTDRTFEAAASYKELQLLAEDARAVPVEDMLEEREQWCKRLKAGSGLNQYVVQRSQSASSRDTSAEPGAHSESGGSCATSSSPTHQPHPLEKQHDNRQRSFQSAGGDGIGDKVTSTPVVYIDETVLPEDLECPSRNEKVLIENENLSCRLNSSQTTMNGSQKSEKIADLAGKLSNERQAMTGNASKPVDSVQYMQRQQIQPVKEFVNSNKTETLDQLALCNSPRSPLMTVPVYMSGLSSDPSTSSTQEGNTDLHEFLETLGSDESRSTLRLSNPEAASKGIAIGIALVNPEEAPLGREIHKIAEVLSLMFHSEKSPRPRKGSIIFLDSVILAKDIQLNDLTFCLRKTWAELGRKYYYACLRWDLDDDHESRSSDQQTHSRLEKHECKRSHAEQRPTLAVSFDESEILMLGEYKSIDPVVHSSGNSFHT